MEGGAKGKEKKKPLDVFNDFKARHAGLLKALTTDVEEFFKLCDPGKENLCLYGLPNGQWEVKLPAEDLPPSLPDPVVGINFARDGMPQKEWLSFIAYHCDAWLLSVAFHASGRFGFDKADRIFGAKCKNMHGRGVKNVNILLSINLNVQYNYLALVEMS